MSELSHSTGAVFLSYGSQDAEAALRICEALRSAGVEVWFDRSELRGGDSWDAQIKKQIHECALFLPVISAHTNAPTEGSFRDEWNLATQRLLDMAQDATFLVPVVIDDAQEVDARVPEEFLRAHWTRLPGGETPPAFVQRVRQLLGRESAPVSTPQSTVSPKIESSAQRKRSAGMLPDSRKIAAILAADIVDYTRLMGSDEHGALALLKARRAMFDQLIGEYGGRGFGSVGDSLMAEFPSAVNATQCALEIQRLIESENATLPVQQRMQLRIGVNLGDIIEEQDGLFGDAVNVAARLQALAKPGGVLISGSLHDHVRQKMPARFIDAGVRKVKNVAEPIRTFEVLSDPTARPVSRLRATRNRRLAVFAASALVLIALGAILLMKRQGQEVVDISDTGRTPHSIAVLPFENLSGEPRLDYLGDGLGEELLNRLVNVPGLQVSARTSSAHFKEHKETAQTIGRILGVNYLVEGSVRKSGDALRVTAQLIDTNTGYQIWSEIFDRQFSDVLAIQEAISLAVLQGLEVPVVEKARAAMLRHATKSPEALDLYLQARKLDKWELDENDRSVSLYEQAIQLDPNFAAAYLRLANSLFARLQAGQLPPDDPGTARIPGLLRKAIELDPQSADAHALLANSMLENFDLAGMEKELRIAESLNPGSDIALQYLSYVYRVAWPPEKGIEFAKRWVRIDPLDKWAQCNVAVAQWFAYRYEDSLRTIRAVIEREPDYWVAHFVHTGTLLDLGRGPDAVVSARRALELHDAVETRADLAVAYAVTGEMSQARRLLAELLEPSQKAHFPPVLHAYVAIALGDEDIALAALERGVAEGGHDVVSTIIWPVFIPLHDEPRFQKLIRQFGLERRIAYLVDRMRNLPEPTR